MNRVRVFSRDPAVGAWICNDTKTTLKEALQHAKKLEAHKYATFIEVDGRVVYESDSNGEDLDP